MGILKHQRGDTDAALEYYLKTKEIMEQINDVRGMIHTYLSLARIHISRDQKENAAAYLDRALAMARTANDRLLLSDVYNDYAQFHADYDELDQAGTALDSAAELVRSEQDKFRLLYLLLTQADYFFLRKDSTALKYAEEAVRVAREIKTRPDEANALRTLGKIQALLNGDYAGGTENIRRSLAIAEEAGLVMVIPQCLKALGEVLTAEGKPGPARQNLDQARVRFQQTGAVREVRKIDAILSSTP